MAVASFDIPSMILVESLFVPRALKRERELTCMTPSCPYRRVSGAYEASLPVLISTEPHLSYLRSEGGGESRERSGVSGVGPALVQPACRGLRALLEVAGSKFKGRAFDCRCH